MPSITTGQVETTSTMFKGGRALMGSTADGEAAFFEAAETELREQIFKEFNTLAVIYGVPSSQFIDEMFQQTATKRQIVGPPAVSTTPSASSVTTAPITQPSQPAFTGSVNLLDMGDEQSTPSPVTPKAIKFSSSASIAPADFQSIWAANVDAFNG